VKIESDGNKLVMTAKRPEGLDEVLKKAKPLIKEKMNSP
jgi:hypothetical protein